jgi:hypothetical protein
MAGVFNLSAPRNNRMASRPASSRIAGTDRSPAACSQPDICFPKKAARNRRRIRRHKLKTLFHLLSGLMLVSAVQAANIVQNPSFEDFVDRTTVPGWNMGPFFTDSNFHAPGPEDGSRFAGGLCGATQDVGQCFLEPLSQQLATTGGTYTLSFWFDLGSSVDDDEIGSNGLIVQWGDQIVVNTGTRDTPDQGYQFITVPGLQGDATKGVLLQFFAFNTTDDGFGVDNVSVVQTAAAPADTPEPAGGWLLAVGFLGLAAFARRRRMGHSA